MATSSQIPLRNIWLLFLYAADLVRFRGQLEGEVEAARDLPDLVGRLLVHVAEQRLRRNLSRGYRPRFAVLSRVRGRIDMLETTTAQLLERGRVACRFDDHTMNTPRNRLVRAALDRLAARVSDTDTAHRCRALAADLSRLGVAVAQPSRAELSTDAIGRNETADRLMVTLSRMVFDLVIPTEDPGDRHLNAQDASEQLVRRLFERAIGNALRLELEPEGWRVSQGRCFAWPCTAATPGISAILPRMQTDIEVSHAGLARRVIVDTKFTTIFTSSPYRDEVLKSGYLYQLYAYLRTQEDTRDPLSMTAEGMLLHPQVGAMIDEAFHVQGHTFRLRTIDLAAPAALFEATIRRIVV